MKAPSGCEFGEENARRDGTDAGRSSDSQAGLQNAIFEAIGFRVVSLCRLARY
jgi:hypothetical protein